MHYLTVRNAGMTIGSEAIERVHKWVIQAPLLTNRRL